MIVLLVLFCMISLTGCADNIKVKPTGQRVESPEIPSGVVMDSDVAILLARLAEALNSCNAQFPEGIKKNQPF